MAENGDTTGNFNSKFWDRNRLTGPFNEMVTTEMAVDSHFFYDAPEGGALQKIVYQVDLPSRIWGDDVSLVIAPGGRILVSVVRDPPTAPEGTRDNPNVRSSRNMPERFDTLLPMPPKIKSLEGLFSADITTGMNIDLSVFTITVSIRPEVWAGRVESPPTIIVRMFPEP